MGYEMRLEMKLSQQLIMTPQLQQAIKLLQLSRMELIETVQQELLENPILEESPEIPADEPNKITNELESKDDGNGVENNEMDWMRYLESRSVSEYHGGYENEDREENESIITESASLADHLEWQIQMTDLDEEIKELAMTIIGHLNDDGYLKTELENICQTNEAEMDDVEEALAVVQELDPNGVGARDLRECLLLQIRFAPPENPLVKPIIDGHIDNLVKKKYKAICQELSISMEELGEALKSIEHLEPKPGRPFGGHHAQYITPDIYVRKVGDEFIIEQNDDGLPKLRVSSFYKNILYKMKKASKEEREYVQEKMRSALWLIRSIHQRQRTIYKVTKSIVKFQLEFFENGIKFLRPLILKDVAEDIEMHESTISRVTTNKYVHTPQGIFELKYFFNSGLESSSGELVASESAKSQIQEIVKDENQKKPFSDQEIVRILGNKHGIKVARRTVTKYREMLGILSSTKRKKVF